MAWRMSIVPKLREQRLSLEESAIMWPTLQGLVSALAVYANVFRIDVTVVGVVSSFWNGNHY